MAKFIPANAARHASTNTFSMVSVATPTRRRLFPLQASCKPPIAMTPRTTSTNISLESSPTMESPRSVVSMENSIMCVDTSACHGKDLASHARYLEQIWSPGNKISSAHIPLSRRGHSPQTDSLRFNSSVADRVSPLDIISVNSASTASQIGLKGNMSEKWKTIGSFNASKELLKFVYQCIDTNSDDKIWITELKRKCIKYPEVGSFLGMDYRQKGGQGFDELWKSGTSVSCEGLCRLLGLQGGKKTEISLSTRRQLVYDFISDNFLVVTLFTIAHVCIQHPIFLKFLIRPENAGNLSHVTDYFNKVNLAGKSASSSMQKSFDDFCCFLDHVCSWNAKLHLGGSTRGPLMTPNGPFASLSAPSPRKEAYSKSPVRGDVQTKVDDVVTSLEKLFSASGRNRPSEILPDKTILDVSGGVVLGRDGLPVTKDEVILCPNGDFLLCSDGHLALRDDLQIGDDRRLLGPDQLPVREMCQPGKALKTNDLLLGSEGIPIISEDGTLVRKTEVMHVGHTSISLNDVVIQSDGTFHDPEGREILGDDGLTLVKGEVLMGHDGKPLLTCEGKPILQHDLKFSNANMLCGPDGIILRNSCDQPLLREDVYIGSDGLPRLDSDGKVVEMKDVVRSFSGTPLLASAFKAPITRMDLKFSKRGKLVGLGTVVRKKDSTPYMRGELLVSTDGKPVLSKTGRLIELKDLV